jgi:hypothetical protein
LSRQNLRRAIPATHLRTGLMTLQRYLSQQNNEYDTDPDERNCKIRQTRYRLSKKP